MQIRATKHPKTMQTILVISFKLRPVAFAGYFVGALAEIASSLVTMYATARLGGLLARFVAGGETSKIWFWLWVDIAAAVGIGLAFWLMQYSKRLLYYRLSRWATHEYIATLCRIDINDYYEETARNRMNKAGSGYAWQIAALNETSLELIYAILRFSAIAVVVAQINWWLIIVIAAFLVPTLISESRIAKVQWFVWDEKGDEKHIIWRLDWLIRQAKNQMEMRSSQVRNYIINRIDTMNDRFYKKQESTYRKLSRTSAGTKVLETAGTALGSIMLLKQFLSGLIALNQYLFLSGALLRIGGALNAIFGTLSRMQEQLLFAENFFAFTAQQPRIIDVPHAHKLQHKQPSEIVFEDVSFSYPGQSEMIFDKLCLTIKPGQHVAIVGENGAGKSTLLKLLMRFYVPDSGRILIDGHDLNEIAIESWYAQLATLFQEFNTYPFPIDENIYIGDTTSKHDKTRMQAAAHMGGVDALVQSYAHGWETVLDSSFEKGVEPSGGQWQRVALARAFYKNANILILDEPTAAIDAKAEYGIFNNIFDHYKDKSAIIVSHRFSTVRRANTILVVDKGRIVEQGSHAQLIKRRGLYYELFSK